MSRSARSPPPSPEIFPRQTTCSWCCRRRACAPRRSAEFEVGSSGGCCGGPAPEKSDCLLQGRRRRQGGRRGWLRLCAAPAKQPADGSAASPAAEPLLERDAGAAHSGAGPLAKAHGNSALIVTALGLTQILAWGSSYYLPAVLARPIAADTGWSLAWVVGGLSIGLAVAGLSSPYVGRAIQAAGGRSVLALERAASRPRPHRRRHRRKAFPSISAAWIVIGLGMGAGLYDAAFATLGRLYLGEARRSIAALTLFGGLASTVCWPLSAFLLEHLGWRGACLAYAGIQLFFALPLLPVRIAAPVGAAGCSRTTLANQRANAPRLIPRDASPALSRSRRRSRVRCGHLDSRLGASADVSASEGHDARGGGDARRAGRPGAGRARARSTSHSAATITRSGRCSPERCSLRPGSGCSSSAFRSSRSGCCSTAAASASSRSRAARCRSRSSIRTATPRSWEASRCRA